MTIINCIQIFWLLKIPKCNTILLMNTQVSDTKTHQLSRYDSKIVPCMHNFYFPFHFIFHFISFFSRHIICEYILMHANAFCYGSFRVQFHWNFLCDERIYILGYHFFLCRIKVSLKEFISFTLWKNADALVRCIHIFDNAKEIRKCQYLG